MLWDKIPRLKPPGSKLGKLKTTSFSKTHIVIFVAVFAAIGGIILLSSKAAGPAVWVSTTGSDSTCVRNDSTKPCLTLNKAYSIAAPGDTIQIAAGTYGSQTVMRGSQSQAGPTVITFQCITAHACKFGGMELGANTGTLAGDTPSYVTFDGLDFNGTVQGYYNQNTDAQPTHITFQNVHIWDITGAGNAIFTLPDADNVVVQNSEIGPVCCDADAFDFTVVRNGAPNPSNTTVDKVFIHDAYDSCTHVPASVTSAYGACSGTGFGDGDPSAHHVDGSQWYGGDNIVFKNSRVYNINQGFAAGQGLFMQEANGGSFSNITVQNNMFASTPNNTLSMSGPGTGSWSGYLHIYYNTIQGNLRLYGDSPSNQIFKPGTSIIVAGNIAGNMQTSNNNSCSLILSDGSTFTPTYLNNLTGSQACGANDKTGTATFVNATTAGTDLHLSGSSQTAVNSGESTYCPATDIDGEARPQGAACDIGADEVTTLPNVWMSSTGNDTTCVRGDQTKPCLSMNKAYAIAQCGDVVSVAGGAYTTQTITNSKACTSSTPVKFVAASGQPTFDNVNVKASYVWIEGMKVPHSLTSASVGFWNVEAPEPGNLPSAVSYVTLKNDEGGGLYIFAEHVDVTGGSYGGFSACLTGDEDLTRIWQENISASGTDYRAASYVTIDGVTIHDGTDNGNKCGDAVNGPHVDAMQILGGHFITIRNSTYYNCPTSCIIGSGFRTGEDNYLIENNFFQEEANPGATLNFSYSSSGDPDTGANMIIRYNTTNGTISTGCTTTSPSCWKVYGNLTAMASCNGGAVWTYNAVANGICTGGGGKTCTPSFVGPTPQSSYGSATIPNFRLNSTDTCAKDAVPTAAGLYPSTDIIGSTRPQGPALDMGAFEFGGTGGGGDTTAPTVSLSAPIAGSTVSGSVTVSANASDNVGVAGVQFKLDGNNLGSEDTTSPYSTTWNAATASNGSHTLTAVARDAAGNTTTSSTVTVTVTGGTNIITIGEPNILASPDNGNANLLLAQSTTLSQSAAIQSLSFYVTNAAGNLRLGIYDATGPGGGPGSLKAQTAEITPTTGWNTAVTTTTPTLSAGTYWLAYLPSDNNLAFLKSTDASSSGKLYSYTYAALPATFSTAPSSTSSHWSFYATLNIGSGGTTPVPGDLNGDGHVTVIDLSILLSHYGTSGTPAQGDCNNDGTINILDLSILLSHYGA